jgi:hypothetical protein
MGPTSKMKTDTPELSRVRARRDDCRQFNIAEKPRTFTAQSCTESQPTVPKVLDFSAEILR